MDSGQDVSLGNSVSSAGDVVDVNNSINGIDICFSKLTIQSDIDLDQSLAATNKSPLLPSSPLADALGGMTSPTDSENSFYTARNSFPMSPGSPSPPPAARQSSSQFNYNRSGARHPVVQESDFAFTVPTVPSSGVNAKLSKSQNSNDATGLNIFASPPPPSRGFEEFVSADTLADTVNANDWDALLGSQTSGNSSVPRAASRWDRDSLYQKFDPLAVRNSPPVSTTSQYPHRSHSHRSPKSSIESEAELVRFQDSFTVASESDVVVVADEDEGNNTLISNSVVDFESQRQSSSPTATLKASSRRESKESELLLALRPEESSDDRMETALVQQELNFRAELCERDDRIRELETRLQQISDSESTKKDNEIEVDNQVKTDLIHALAQIEEMKAKVQVSEEENRALSMELEQLSLALQNAQNAVSDINEKNGQLKSRLENSRNNEELLVQRDAAMSRKMAECDAQLNEIKATVKNKLDNMFQTYETKFKGMDGEAGRLRAQLRRAEMKVEGLENDVSQKVLEIQKLSALCDDLILQSMKDGQGR